MRILSIYVIVLENRIFLIYFKNASHHQTYFSASIKQRRKKIEKLHSAKQKLYITSHIQSLI